jgi:hypothetical protein
MRTTALILIFTAIPLAASSQTQWVHEVLLQGDIALSGGQFDYAVNKDGIPVYSSSKPGGALFHAWRYRTNLDEAYLGPGTEGFATAINDLGHAAYRARNSASYHVMVEGHDYFTDVFGQSRDPNLDPGVRYVDNNDKPFWSTERQDNYRIRVFHGTDELSAGYEVVDFSPDDMNRNGDSVWVANVRTNPNDSFSYDLFRNNVDYSKQILGSGSYGYSPRINDNGDVIWSGGYNAIGDDDLYLNGQNLTTGMPKIDGVVPYGINNKGDFVWVGFEHRPYKQKVYKNMTDISTPIFGDEAYNAGDPHLSDNGDVVWTADSKSTGRRLFHNADDISSSLLGTNTLSTSFTIRGIDRNGNAMWSGYGALTSGLPHVYSGQFDLTRDALGPNFTWGNAGILAGGDNGSVLWGAWDSVNGGRLYLSTPVPEPGWIVPLGMAIGILIRRRAK